MLERSALRLGRALPPGEGPTGTHWIGGWVGLRAGLDTDARGNSFYLCRGSNLGRPVYSQTLHWQSYPSSAYFTKEKLKVLIPAPTWLFITELFLVFFSLSGKSLLPYDGFLQLTKLTLWSEALLQPCSRSVNQEIPMFFLYPNMQYSYHENRPLDPVPGHMSPFHTPYTTICLNIILPSMHIFWVVPCLSFFDQNLCIFSSLPCVVQKSWSSG
jgi:hypothetical protein